MANEDHYKGYKIEYRSNVNAGASAPYSPAVFFISRKRGEHVKLVHTGEVVGTFSSPQDAFLAAHKAARTWIDEHGEQ